MSTVSKAEMAALKKINILKDLDDAELKKVISLTNRVEASAGTVLMEEGSIGDTMYFFVKGVVDITKNLTLKVATRGFENVEKSMVKLDSNIVSFFGEMAMIDESPRSANVTASTDCLLLEITKADFEALCEEDPAAGLKMLRRISQVLSRNVRKGNEDVLKLTTALSIALSRQ
jgi:CRP/FNR family cyclic AMP-dependent transcriptional regulator